MDTSAVRKAPGTVEAASVLTDEDVVARVRAGEHALFEILMRRHNQRLYRAARAILASEEEVEDVLQQAYLNAFAHLHQFESRSQFSTWLTRILINEARHKRRKLARASAAPGLPAQDSASPQKDSGMEEVRASGPGPEQQAYASELRQMLEGAVDSLSENYRLVFVLREVEGLSTAETASTLEIGDEAVKTRLHRARAMMRQAVAARIGAASHEAFQFHAPRCDRVVAAVLAAIALR